MQYYIYRHVRLDTNEPFYIGLAGKDENCNSLQKEFKRAFSLSQTSRNDSWVQIIKSIGKQQVLVEILFESDSLEEACLKETEFIKLYGRCDLRKGPLTNRDNGGGEKGGIGRTRLRANKRKKNCTITMSDDEHTKLVTLAKAAGKNISEYIILKCKL